jgi:hypothetical protein
LSETNEVAKLKMTANGREMATMNRRKPLLEALRLWDLQRQIVTVLNLDSHFVS